MVAEKYFRMNGAEHREAVKPQVLILGGGLTGLATAYRLLELAGDKYKVTLLEKSATLGGQAISLKISDIVTDLGPHRIHTELPEIRNFLLTFLGQRIFSVKRRSRMWLCGKWLQYPPVLRELTQILGKGKMLNFALDYVLARATHLILRPKQLNYETAMLGLFGKSLYNFLLYPYTKKTWCLEPNRLSADIVHTRITATPGKFIRRLFRRQRCSKSTLTYDTTVSEFLYTDGGIQTLADAFADYILRHKGEIICQAEVIKINPGARLQCSFRAPSSPASSTETISADYIINTLPLTDFMQMLSDGSMPQSVKKSVESLKYLAMILVFIVVKKPRLSADSWLYFPEETTPINRAYETKNFQHTLGPPDKTLLCCEITCFRNDKTWNLPDDEIATQVVKALLPCALFTESQVLETSVYRLTHAYPVYELNYDSHLQIIWGYLKQFPRLLTAGRQGLFHHNNMDHCIYEGFKVAECLVHHPDNPAAFWYPSLKQFFRLRIID